MKIKRFFSHDMRNVIRMVREELGSEAVILSNNRVNGGIEVVAAVDYDETIFKNESKKATQSTAKQDESNHHSDENKQENSATARAQAPSYHQLAENEIQQQQAQPPQLHTPYEPQPEQSGHREHIQFEVKRDSDLNKQVQSEPPTVQQAQARAMKAQRMKPDSYVSSNNTNPVTRNEVTRHQQSTPVKRTLPRAVPKLQPKPVQAKSTRSAPMPSKPARSKSIHSKPNYPGQQVAAKSEVEFSASRKPDMDTGNIEPMYVNENDYIGGETQAPNSRHEKKIEFYQGNGENDYANYNKYTKEEVASDNDFMSLDEEDNNFSSNDAMYESAYEDQNVLESLAFDDSEIQQDPTLEAMRSEISGLRGLLENQLSGLAWGDLARKNPIRAKLIRQLIELDLNPNLAGRIADSVSDHDDYNKAWQAALNLLVQLVPTLGDDFANEGGVVALIGSTGVGKTTTLAKLAARYALRYGRDNVALVTTDTYRIAAHEQLRTYGRILGIPVRVTSQHDELEQVLKTLSDRSFVLVDSAGMSHRDQRLIEQFKIIEDSTPSLKTLLVLPTTTHRKGLDEIVNVYENMNIDGCVLTKLDETTSLGGAVSVVVQNRLPVAYVSEGQRVPEDLQVARPHMLINKSIKIARQNYQPLEDEAVEQAYSRMNTNAHV